jgi:hypothetical protein
MSELKVDKITPRLGTTLTLGDSGDTINFGSGVLPNFENLTVTGDLTVDTNSLKVDSTNNYVGIGTASPSVALDVVGTANIGSELNVAGASALRVNTSRVSIDVSGSAATPSLVFNGDTNTGLFRVSSDTLGISTAGTERMRIDSSGNVGVGESSIESKFHVKDSLASTGVGTSSNPIVIIQNERLNTGTSSAVLRFDTNEIAGSQQHPRASIGAEVGSQASNVDGRLLFATTDVSGNMTERMRIDSSGNLLVGTTDTSIYNNSGTGQGGASINIPSSGSGYVQVARDSGTALFVNRLVNDGDIIDFRKNGAQVGSIGTFTSKYYIASAGNSGLKFRDDLNCIMPCGQDGANSDADQDLGQSGVRFKNLYLSGGVRLGGTGSANALDDYEEGTFTPTMPSASSVNITSQEGKYVKIGKYVWVQGRIQWNSLSGTTPKFGGLPFTVENTGGEAGYSMSITPYVNEGLGSIPSGRGYIQGYFEKGTTTITYTWQPNTLNASFTSSGNIYFAGGYVSV